MAKKVTWKDCKNKTPKDDQTVLGANESLREFLPILCFYEKSSNSFFPLDGNAYPLVITHWTEVPMLDGKKK